MTSIRPYRIFLLFALAIGLAGYAVWPREPLYEGRELSEWVGDMVDLDGSEHRAAVDESGRRAWEVRNQEAVSALRSIGTNALPHLLRWLRSAPGPSPLRDKLEELLEKHSPWTIRLPQNPDHTDQAILGFRALGSAAEPALPELRRLLHKPTTWEGAVSALGAIGPAAVPILASELTNSKSPSQSQVVDVLVHLALSAGPSIVPVLVDGVTNRSCVVHAECLTGLGDLGPQAREFAPWLGALAREPGNPLAGLAMRVMAEVSDRPEQYVPLFSDRLNHTNLAKHAAFALGRLGPEGIPPLLQALTNQEPDIKAAALAALDPQFRNRHPSGEAKPPARRFSALCFSFDRILAAWSRKGPATLHTPVLEDYLVSQRLGGALDHPDPAIRIEIVRMLASHGRSSAIGLSRAVADTDVRVRTEAQAALVKAGIEVRGGGIIRGLTDKRRIALIFSGHDYAEGGETILNELAKHKAQASFFLTAEFLRKHEFGPLVQRLYRDGHYLGPHSDEHLLYCSAEEPRRTSVTREQFDSDFRVNLDWMHRIGDCGPLPSYFLPPPKNYNLEIAEWASYYFYAIISYSPGTRSTADCTSEADPGFVSSNAIFDSIVAKEREDPHGLNGCLLLLHVGSGPSRTDKFHARFGELLDYLTGKGYQFVAVDDLFDPQAAADRRRRISENIANPVPVPDTATSEAFRKRYGLDRR